MVYMVYMEMVIDWILVAICSTLFLFPNASTASAQNKTETEGPIQPVQPIQLVQSGQSVQSGQPAQSAQSAQSVQTLQSVQPVQSVQAENSLPSLKNGICAQFIQGNEIQETEQAENSQQSEANSNYFHSKISQHIIAGRIPLSYSLRKYFSPRPGASPVHTIATSIQRQAGQNTSQEIKQPDRRNQISINKQQTKKNPFAKEFTDETENLIDANLPSQRPLALPDNLQWRRVRMLRIPPGRFQANYTGAGKRQTIELSHTIEVSDIMLTQAEFTNIMGYNPSNFQKGDGKIPIQIKKGIYIGSNVDLATNHPVNNITFWTILQYLNRRSKFDGLIPAYDLNHVAFALHSNTQQDHNLYAKSGFVRVNAPNGDIYQTNGYRLMTRAERLYLESYLGNNYTDYYFKDQDSATIAQHAWYKPNANERSHPVAQLLPLVLPTGEKIFDLLGNIQEVLWDCIMNENLHSNYLLNPTYSRHDETQVDEYRSQRGGSWATEDESEMSFFREEDDYIHPNSRSQYSGFRIVRTID